MLALCPKLFDIFRICDQLYVVNRVSLVFVNSVDVVAFAFAAAFAEELDLNGEAAELLQGQCKHLTASACVAFEIIVRVLYRVFFPGKCLAMCVAVMSGFVRFGTTEDDALTFFDLGLLVRGKSRFSHSSLGLS